MSSTSFVDYNTVIQASWLNDVNTNTYQNSDLSYPVTATYAANINITSVTQTIGYLGQAYSPILSALPFMTSGTFEVAKFQLIQGVSAGDVAAPGFADLAGYRDPAAPAFLKTISDMNSGDPVNVLRLIPKTEHAAIRAGTSVYDCAPRITEATTYINRNAIKGGELVFPTGICTVFSSIPQLPRVSFRGSGSRQSAIKWGATDLTGYTKGVVYAVAGTDATPDFVFSTGISGLWIDGGGLAPVALALRGQQENCRFANLLLGGFLDSGLEVLPFPPTTHGVSFDDLHVIPAAGATVAHAIRASHLHKCTLRNITTAIGATGFYERGIYLYNNPILNVFDAIHTESARYGFYVIGGANNSYRTLEASNLSGNGVTHFYTTSTRYKIDAIRTISGFTNHLQDGTNTIAAGTNTDSISIECGDSYFKRLSSVELTNGTISGSRSIEGTRLTRGVDAYAGISGNGQTNLKINAYIAPSATGYVEINLGAGSAGFAGQLKLFAIGDERYATTVYFGGYAAGDGTVSGAQVSSQTGSNTARLTISAPVATATPTVGKIRIPVLNTSTTLGQVMEVSVEITIAGRQASGIAMT